MNRYSVSSRNAGAYELEEAQRDLEDRISKEVKVFSGGAGGTTKWLVSSGSETKLMGNILVGVTRGEKGITPYPSPT